MISIITATYNAVATFEQTIRSIACQNIEVEFIVIDGGSTDGTIEVAQQNRDIINVFVSEPDNGIYDAMNKGIDRARGDWLFFLGADDQLIEGVLAQITPYLQSDLAVVYGDVQHDTGGVMRSHVGARCLLENRIHHQGAFYHRRLFDNFRYNQKFRVAADYELTLRIYLQKQPFLYVPYIISLFASGGYSSQGGNSDINSIRGIYLQNSVANSLLSFILNIYEPSMRTGHKIIHRLRKIFNMRKIRLSMETTYNEP